MAHAGKLCGPSSAKGHGVRRHPSHALERIKASIIYFPGSASTLTYYRELWVTTIACRARTATTRRTVGLGLMADNCCGLCVIVSTINFGIRNYQLHVVFRPTSEDQTFGHAASDRPGRLRPIFPEVAAQIPIIWRRDARAAPLELFCSVMLLNCARGVLWGILSRSGIPLPIYN
jgi:hypothetical protein